jgi:hypothetical protein
LGLPEEDFPAAAAEEPHAVNVPTDLRAAPALGLEHLVSDVPHEGGPTTSDLMDSPAFMEGEVSGAESNPYQITEEGGGETPQSGVGRFFSKAKSWFGGASAVEGYEEGAPAGAAAIDEGEAETITLSPGQVKRAEVKAEHAASEIHDDLRTAAPMSQPTSTEEAEKMFTAFRERVEAPAEPPQAAAIQARPEVEAQHAASDLHVSGVVSSWEPSPPAEAVHEFAEPVLEPPPVEEAPVASAPELEITSPPSSHQVPAGAGSDSMLVTDASEMSSQFPTRFGVKDAEPIPVGNASDYPELYGHPTAAAEPESTSDTQEIEAPELIDAAEAAEAAEPGPAEHTADFDPGVAAEVAATMDANWTGNEQAAHAAAEPEPSHSASQSNDAPLAGWSAEETNLEENEIGVSLHEEMHQHLSEPIPGTESEAAIAGAASPASENRHDDQLAAAMAAAMGNEVTPALAEAVHQAFTGESTMALDKNTAVIAEIVHRVTERMKPELVAEIAKELASEIKKEKKKG